MYVVGLYAVSVTDFATSTSSDGMTDAPPELVR